MTIEIGKFRHEFNNAYDRVLVWPHLVYVPPVQGLEYTDEGFLSCKLPWATAASIPGFIPGLVRVMNDYKIDDYVWFAADDPYLGSKPFSIEWIGMNRLGEYILYVHGDRSERIVRKWTDKLSKFFRAKCTIAWLAQEVEK